MKLILKISQHHQGSHPTYHTITHFPATIGRGFQNDVILADSYISPKHLKIKSLENDFIVHDLKSKNGFTFKSKTQTKPLKINSGDTIQIGQTDIQFFKPDHPVAETLKQQPPFKNSFLISNPLFAWGYFLITALLMVSWVYTEVWTEEIDKALTIITGSTLGSIFIWSILWTAAGRLIKNKNFFTQHIAISSLYMIIGVFTWYVDAYTRFLMNNNWFAQTISYSLNFILLSFLLYASLNFSTRLSEKKRRFSSILLSFGIVSGIFIVSFVSKESFQQKPVYDGTLKAYLSVLAPAKTVGTFMKENRKLFQENDLKKKQIN